MRAPDPFSIFRPSPPIGVLLVNADRPFVQAGGGKNLTEKQYDHARNVNVRAGIACSPISNYDTAMMGGEPYSVWY